MGVLKAISTPQHLHVLVLVVRWRPTSFLYGLGMLLIPSEICLQLFFILLPLFPPVVLAKENQPPSSLGQQHSLFLTLLRSFGLLLAKTPGRPSWVVIRGHVSICCFCGCSTNKLILCCNPFRQTLHLPAELFNEAPETKHLMRMSTAVRGLG